MARRRRKHSYDGLAVGLMVGVAAPTLVAAAALTVPVADEKYPRWWIVIALGALGGFALLLGLALYFMPRLRKDRLSIQVAWTSMNVVSQLPDDHPRKGMNEGAVLLNGVRFTSLEGEDVSLGVELLADFPGGDPARLSPEPHPGD
jgi:hypothetical protein